MDQGPIRRGHSSPSGETNPSSPSGASGPAVNSNSSGPDTPVRDRQLRKLFIIWHVLTFIILICALYLAYSGLSTGEHFSGRWGSTDSGNILNGRQALILTAIFYLSGIFLIGWPWIREKKRNKKQ